MKMFLWWFTMILSSGQFSRMATTMFLSMAFPQQATNASINSSLSSDPQPKLFSFTNSTGEGASSKPSSSSFIAGTYDYLSSHNFEEYLQELGVGFVLRRLASLASPSVTLTQLVPHEGDSGERWKVSTSTIFKSHEMEFQMGQPLMDTTMDGRRVMVLIHQTAANEWTEVQRPCATLTTSSCSAEDLKGSTTLVRTFLPDRMQVDMKVGKVKSSSVFLRRIQPDFEGDF